MAEPKRHMDVP